MSPFFDLNRAESFPAESEDVSLGSSSLRSSRSSVSGARCRLSIPFTATEMDPVSSETMATTASEFSLMPIPARWRMPRSRERLIFPDRGRTQPAPTMCPFRTMTAPSWSGALFQKRFLRSSAATVESRAVPVLMMSSSGTFRSKTIRAPTLSRERAA